MILTADNTLTWNETSYALDPTAEDRLDRVLQMNAIDWELADEQVHKLGRKLLAVSTEIVETGRVPAGWNIDRIVQELAEKNAERKLLAQTINQLLLVRNAR